MSAGHWLLYGQTGAGKSTYLRYVVIPRALRAKRPVILFDPFGETWPDGVWATSDRVAFHEKVWKSSNALVIHDEAGEAGKADRALEKLAVQGRHLGHVCVFAAQRPQQVATTVRGQCGKVVVFHLVPQDAEFLADKEFGNDALLEAATLQPLHYIVCDRWSKVSRGKIDPKVFETPE